MVGLGVLLGLIFLGVAVDHGLTNIAKAIYEKR